MALSAKRVRELFQQYGFDPDLAPDEETLNRPVEFRPTFGERVGRAAARELTLGFVDQEVPEAETFGETVADVVGTILGAAPLIAGTVMTAGAPAGALAAARLARFGPRAARLGNILARETIGGAAFGGLHGAAEAIRGAPAEQVAGTVGREAALGFAGGAIGEAIGAGARAWRARRGVRPAAQAAAEAVEQAPTPQAGAQVEPEQVLSEEVLQQGLDRYAEDLRRFYQERPELLQEAFDAYRTETHAELTRVVEEIRPEVDRRMAELRRREIELRIASGEGIPTTRRQLVDFVWELLGGEASGISKAEVRRMKRADLEELVVEALQGEAQVRDRLAGVVREVAQERGIDFDALLQATDTGPRTPEEMLDYLVNRERAAIASGVKELPRQYLDVRPQTPAQQVVQEAVAPQTRPRAETPKAPRTDPLEQVATTHPDPDVRATANHVRAVEQQVVEEIAQEPVETELAKAVRLLGEESPLNPTGPVDPKTISRWEWARRAALSSFESVLRRFGPAGQRVAGGLRVWEMEGANIRGSLMSRFGRRFLALSDKEAEDALAYATGRLREGQKISQRAREMGELWRQIAEEVGLEFEQSGAPMRVVERTETGEFTTRVVPFRRIENYEPRLIDWNKVLDPKSGDFRNEAVRKVAIALAGNANERSMAAARNVLQQLRRRPDLNRNPLAFFQHARVARAIPDELLLPAKARIAIWMDAVSRQMAAQRVWGVQGNTYGRLMTELDELFTSGITKDQEKYLKVGVSRILGLEGDPGVFADIGQFLRNFNAMTSLTLAAIPNVTQGPLASVLRYGVKSLFNGLVDIMGRVPKDELVEFASRAGAAVDPIAIAEAMAEVGRSGWFSALTSKALRAYGFTGTEIFNQVLATRVARHGVDDMFNNLRRSLDDPNRVKWVDRIVGKDPKRLREQFTRAGVDIDAALERGFLTEDEYRLMAAEFNRATQYPASQLDVPLWTTSELGKVTFQFKRFLYRQTKMFEQEVWRELKRGNFRPLVIWATLWPAAGIPVRYVRDLLAGREKPEDEPFLKTYVELMSWTGGFGILEEVSRFMRGSPAEAVAEFLGGPSVRLLEDMASTAVGLGRAGLAALEGEPEDVQRGLAQAARGAVRLATPTSIGAPLARGDIPGARLVMTEEEAAEAAQPLRRIFQPDQYDPTGVLRARQTLDKHLDRIGKGFIEWQVSRFQGRNDPTPYIRAVREAADAGLNITRDDILNLLNRPTFQEEMFKQLSRKTKDPALRRYFQIQLERVRYEAELRRQQVPQAAQPLVPQAPAQ